MDRSQQPAQRVEAPPGKAASRRTLLRRVAVARGGALAGGGVIAALPRLATSAPSAAQNTKILGFLLYLEDLQREFYSAALDAGILSGEVQQFASVASADERTHFRVLRRVPGSPAAKNRTFDFREAVADRNAFVHAAFELEDLVTRAYIGQGANVTPDVSTIVARITSVEARHTAWISSIAGRDPAPRAQDVGAGAREVMRVIRRLGFV